MDQNIMKKTTDELNKIGTSLTIEKKNREDSEQAIFDMLRDVVNRVKSEIDYERKNRSLFFCDFMAKCFREQTEETLLNLLEDTCNKINAASNL